MTATPVEMALVVATPAATAPAATAPARTAPAAATPAAGKEEEKDAESDTSGNSDMEWVEVRGRRRSRSRSSEGRGDCVKRACGSGEEITPFPRTGTGPRGRPGGAGNYFFWPVYGRLPQDDLLATPSPHH